MKKSILTPAITLAITLFAVLFLATTASANELTVRFSENYTVKAVLPNGTVFAEDQDGNGGFLSQTGKALTDFIYGSHEGFRYSSTTGLISLSVNGYYGLLNISLNEIAPFIFFEPLWLSGNVFIGCTVFGYGLLDLRGNPLSEFSFAAIYPTARDDVFIVSDDYYYGLIDAKGKTIIPLKYEYIFYVSEDGLVTYYENGFYGYIDLQDQVVIPAQFTAATRFVSGRASVRNSEQKWAVIDTKGKLVTDYIYDSPIFFNLNGAAECTTKDGMTLINASGKILTETVYQDITSPSSSLFIAQTETAEGAKLLLLGSDGKEITNPIYTELQETFDISGTQYFIVESGKCGIIDTSGNIIAPLIYDSIQNAIVDGYYKVEKDGKFGIIRIDGREIIAPDYTNISGPFGGYFVASDASGKYGILDSSGKVISEFAYDSISAFNGKYAVFTMSGQTGTFEIANPKHVVALTVGSSDIVSDWSVLMTDAPCVIRDSRILVSAKWLGQALGLSADCVQWDASSEKAVLYHNNSTIVAKKNSAILLVNGEEIEMDTPAVIINDRIYLPISYFAKALNIKYTWYDSTKTVVFNAH